jgi:hypothetical protein
MRILALGLALLISVGLTSAATSATGVPKRDFAAAARSL